jgi:hypothetical protein
MTINKKAIMTITGLIIHMEDMAEDTMGEDTKEENTMEENIVEEDTKEETVEDIKEDLIRRSTMFAIGQVVG